MLRVVSDRLDNAQALRTAFTEQKSVTWCEVLWTLDETERDSCAVTSSNELAVNVDDGARLGDRADVKHGLILGLDGCGVRENEH